jgi:hypothetical protein
VSGTLLHQDASRLVTQEQYLLQAVVADNTGQEIPELEAVQPRVMDAFQRIADSTGRAAREFQRIVLEERLFQYGTSQVLNRLKEGHPTAM